MAVPRAKLRILDDWGGDQTLGMRASGSHSIEIKDAFVPAHHVVPMQGLFTRAEDMRDSTPGHGCMVTRCISAVLPAPSHVAYYPAIGAAKAALDEYLDIIRIRKRPSRRSSRAPSTRIIGVLSARRRS